MGIIKALNPEMQRNDNPPQHNKGSMRMSVDDDNDRQTPDLPMLNATISGPIPSHPSSAATFNHPQSTPQPSQSSREFDIFSPQYTILSTPPPINHTLSRKEICDKYNLPLVQFCKPIPTKIRKENLNQFTEIETTLLSPSKYLKTQKRSYVLIFLHYITSHHTTSHHTTYTFTFLLKYRTKKK